MYPWQEQVNKESTCDPLCKTLQQIHLNGHPRETIRPCTNKTFEYYGVREIKNLKESESEYQYTFHTFTPKSSNQSTLYIWYIVLIGCFSSTNAKIVFKTFTNVRSDLCKIIQFSNEFLHFKQYENQFLSCNIQKVIKLKMFIYVFFYNNNWILIIIYTPHFTSKTWS